MRRNRAAVAVACAAAFVVGLTACSTGGSVGSNSSGTVHLVFQQFDPAAEVTGLQSTVSKWNKLHPDIQVDMQTLSPSNPQQLAREANSGSGPDVVQVPYANVAFLAQPKILLPLNSLMKKYPLAHGTGDLLAKDMVTFDGKMWAVPWTADTMALVYRPSALTAAGISSPPATWGELASDATAISKQSGGKTAGFCFGASGSATAAQWFAINYYMWNHGHGFVKKDSAGSWVTDITQSQLTSTIDYFNGLFVSGATPQSFQSVNDYTDPSIANGLANGSCAMTYAPPQTFQTLVKTAGDKVTTAPMPGGLKDGSTHLGGRGLAINRNAKHPQQAWEFIQYLMSPATFKTYEQYPASKSTLKSLTVPKNQDGFVQQLPHSVSFGRYIGSNMPVVSMQQLVNQQFSAVYSGQSSSSRAATAILSGLKAGIGG
ncbi:sugar ABC transporter substrate-binding protein [Glaciihabitans sp. UYNi722]|uniref:ABC transporter substrate-binding protein n=1 Tax=Glaciihabitans sp. UYNi722 TaxID=3156344 RepID=UPI0033990E97